ncbi:leucyl/phenylalanyl-tRNA--protein transferase [Propionivibrio sp.]|uniref:leucyl/phenylalanyl-tRNA--protein transferase n=1 Tax=Propionivibrio sp. TaxID=2212460 RepID=UPI0025E80CAB|nr:leucyl/phenylalanyl-tRNA--protein transferase [Propionivibrio sp.]MBK7356883.1 leucyl/phenylalanyl-tRNA--protein transferase [Propionivibrio sp.]MBK8401686.1 leucyl/phenylalanyl-tRNA--protein transferase [Propionivibrio sp.]MBK8745042.1 leucyl/phenylalanyl-tRNA--protein transferase [Propionivibrio sp.]MBK8893904.1 leucyl/phenylalanyl-tRNA--protein transferase [Propionivibrio sp.]MBL0208189.1 leucyl/phenylalanyl-tRNA--protein transferase [Propionivibrio sp.]
MIPWLDSNTAFPSLELALSEPNGLLCAGGDLSPQRIVQAYRQGIFPWFTEGEPILWWSPDPRMVLVPSEFRVSRSLRRTLRASKYQVRLDCDFRSVIDACARARRIGQAGTWITDEMQTAYCTLHELGYAHSVEVLFDHQLVGGLYGLAIGKMFYGESMFSHATDASKIALAHLVRLLDSLDFGLIDCQMNTPHLASLGAREIPRRDFTARLHELTAFAPIRGRWPGDGANQAWDW